MESCRLRMQLAPSGSVLHDACTALSPAGTGPDTSGCVCVWMMLTEVSVSHLPSSGWSLWVFILYVLAQARFSLLVLKTFNFAFFFPQRPGVKTPEEVAGEFVLWWIVQNTKTSYLTYFSFLFVRFYSFQCELQLFLTPWRNQLKLGKIQVELKSNFFFTRRSDQYFW